jgi:pyrroline-5-carboxylate reductase
MAEALVKGSCGQGRGGARIICSDRNPARASSRSYGVRFTSSNREAAGGRPRRAVREAEIMNKLLERSRVLDQKKLVISIAAGVPIAPSSGRSARRPHREDDADTPALVGAGATALTAGEHATEEDLQQARALFDAIGRTVIVDEPQLDAVTGLSGSGPAYIFLVIEALSDAGVKMGLARATAQELAAQTVLGSAKLLIETGEHPGRLKDQVTSPGGTAIAGLHTLEAGGLRTTLMNAVEAATNRAKELGKKFLDAEE